MKHRTIRQVIPAQKVNMGGHLLDQPLPYQGIEQIDPFLLIHHWNKPIKGGYKQKEVGVGPHPHRGFSPVTFVYKGDLQHRDSLGNNQIVHEGGTQWMHAGRGITHSERPSTQLAEHGGENEFIQFWVNTPSAYKMEQPYYLPLHAEDTPTVKQGKATIQIIAGEFNGVQGAAKTYSLQTLLRISSTGEEQLTVDLPSTYNTILYVLNGKLTIDKQNIQAKDMVWFQNDGEQIHLQMNEESRFIILSGEPIGEKVTSYGPFVMNTQTEVMEALRDAKMGKMGVLIEEF